ncbi:GlxA family transcriptional regulator (plasmid) [Peteryoungia desertarenae]|uniref:GlxA family transcriptional regulator n=1 Tax=Peteryoungia desertarenae TaxID=1813451 RepID=A0ABX6QUB2_9HYPH|nr:GlxA family transcriptional regulator [Peteryoungia desertarenae]QLF71807.1 GlxA family transcriptional regulator [Peteryoungia desertarenae]
MRGEAEKAAHMAERLNVAFILARSFTLSAFSLFVDTLRLASDEADRSGRRFADWQVLSSRGNLIRSSCGIRVAPTSGLVEPTQFDYIVVVGGLLDREDPVDDETLNYLRLAASRKIPLLGVCTGTFILAEAGLMSEHETCVSWLHYHDFRERFPALAVRADRIYRLDRLRGSCAGGSAAADMAAHIVRRHIGPSAERNAMEVLQIDQARTRFAVQPRRPLSIECEDPRIRTVVLMMEQNVEDVLSINVLASAVGLSRRQLERLFVAEIQTTPSAVYRRIRLERASHLLTNTKVPLIEIALAVGYVNVSHFSRSFRSVYGCSATEWRLNPST